MYLLWRIDEEIAWENAASLLEDLAAYAKRSDDPCLIIKRLGPAHQKYTFWFFAALQHESFRIAIKPKVIEPYHALQVRLKEDPKLMTMWIQFLRWRQDRYFQDTLKEERESALVRVELAQILAIPDDKNKRLAYMRWILDNSTRGDFVDLNPPPTLPFPEWSGPVFDIPRGSK